MDNPPPSREFGDVLVAPLAAYEVGDSVVAQFVAANPRVSNYPLFVPVFALMRTGCRTI